MIVLNVLENLSIIFYELVYMSIKASIISIIVFIFLRILRNKIKPKYRYLLSLVIIIILVIPIKINFKYNITSCMPWNMNKNLSNSYNMSLNEENYFISDNFQKELLDENNSILIKNNFNLSFIIKYIIPVIWLIAVTINSLILIITNIIFLRRTKDLICKDERINNILENSKRKFKINNRKIKIFIGNKITVPSLFGIKTPKIFLPYKAYSLKDEELEYVIYHELIHYKRKDNWILLIIIMLQVLYRFNFVIYLFLNKIKDNMEYAVDERVTANLDDNKSLHYCYTLINLSSENFEKVLLANRFSESKNFLSKRIQNIKYKTENNDIKYIIFYFIIFIVITVFVYTETRILKIDDINKLLMKSITNDKKVEINIEYSSNNIEENSYLNDKLVKYSKSSKMILMLKSLLNDVDNRNLFYKHLRNEVYNSKQCVVISIYSKTNNNFESDDYWIDVESGLIVKGECYSNRKNFLKPSKPICIINYIYK